MKSFGLSSMLHRYCKICLVGGMMLCLQPCKVAAVKVDSLPGQTFVTFFHTNDTHSCVEPVSPYIPTDQADKGGYMRRAAWVDSLRAVNHNVVLVDCGDISQGSTYYSLFRGEAEITLMNSMKYDAMTIGNHEFDFGVSNLARLSKLAHFPIVCANYHFEGTEAEGLIKPYTIIWRSNVKIGIFGLSPKLDGLVANSTCKGVRFEHPVEAARRVVTELKNQGCDLIVCISHLGWDESERDFSDQYFITHTSGIDAVFGGHSHTFFPKPIWLKNEDGHLIPYAQKGKNGAHVGMMKFLIQK